MPSNLERVIVINPEKPKGEIEFNTYWDLLRNRGTLSHVMQKEFGLETVNWKETFQDGREAKLIDYSHLTEKWLKDQDAFYQEHKGDVDKAVQSLAADGRLGDWGLTDVGRVKSELPEPIDLDFSYNIHELGHTHNLHSYVALPNKLTNSFTATAFYSYTKLLDGYECRINKDNFTMGTIGRDIHNQRAVLNLIFLENSLSVLGESEKIPSQMEAVVDVLEKGVNGHDLPPSYVSTSLNEILIEHPHLSYEKITKIGKAILDAYTEMKPYGLANFRDAFGSFLKSEAAQDEDQLANFVHIISNGTIKMGEAMKDLCYKQVPIEERIAKRKQYPKESTEVNLGKEEKKDQNQSRLNIWKQKFVSEGKKLAKEKLQAQKDASQAEIHNRKIESYVQQQEKIYNMVVDGLGPVVGPIAYAIGNPHRAMSRFSGMHALYKGEAVGHIADGISMNGIEMIFDYLAKGLLAGEVNALHPIGKESYTSIDKLEQVIRGNNLE